MRIGIIGPTKIERFCRLIGMDVSVYLSKVVELAKTLANLNHEIICVPEKKSISELFMIEYKKAGGKKSYSMLPMDDTEFGLDHMNQDIGDEIINCVTWRNQPWMLAQESDILISLGFGAGTMGEISATKYYKVENVIVIEDFITSRLPREADRDIKIEYVKAIEVPKHL